MKQQGGGEQLLNEQSLKRRTARPAHGTGQAQQRRAATATAATAAAGIDMRAGSLQHADCSRAPALLPGSALVED